MTQGNIFGLPVSGSPRDIAIFTFGPAQDAPAWLTGADFGIEGSALLTALLTAWLAVACVAAFIWWRRVQPGRAGTPIPTPKWVHREPERAAVTPAEGPNP